MNADELTRAIQEAKAAEAEHPHREVAQYRTEGGLFKFECACGKTFTASTSGRVVGSWRRHRNVEADRAAHVAYAREKLDAAEAEYQRRHGGETR